MFFRLVVLLIMLSVLAIFTPLRGIAMQVILWIGVFTLIIQNAHRSWRKKRKVYSAKSLTFGIKSMAMQKQNFSMIDYIFARDKKINALLKTFSVGLDGLRDAAQQTNDQDDHWNNSSRSGSITNRYYSD